MQRTLAIIQNQPILSEGSNNDNADLSSTHLVLSTAIDVIKTERLGLKRLEQLYRTDEDARKSFAAAVELLSNAAMQDKKTVVSGVGKSGMIAQKIAATMTSLGIPSYYLHPVDALHGDLGIVGNVSRYLQFFSS